MNFDNLYLAYQYYKLEIGQQKKDAHGPPLVLSHEDSRWHAEIYFEGFVAGISEFTVDTVGDAGNLCLLQKDNVYLIAQMFDVLREETISTHHQSEWTWNNEYYKILETLCSAAAQLVAIDEVCAFD